MSLFPNRTRRRNDAFLDRFDLIDFVRQTLAKETAMSTEITQTNATLADIEALEQQIEADQATELAQDQKNAADIATIKVTLGKQSQGIVVSQDEANAAFAALQRIEGNVKLGTQTVSDADATIETPDATGDGAAPATPSDAGATDATAPGETPATGGGS